MQTFIYSIVVASLFVLAFCEPICDRDQAKACFDKVDDDFDALKNNDTECTGIAELRMAAEKCNDDFYEECASVDTDNVAVEAKKQALKAELNVRAPFCSAMSTSASVFITVALAAFAYFKTS